MSEPQGTLNSEPADPQERAENNLPPKSYADVAQEPAEDDTTENGQSSQNGDGSSFKSNGTVKKTPSNKANAEGKPTEDKIVLEKYLNGDGSVLASVRPDPSYNEALQHDKKVAPRKPAESSKSKSKKQDTPRSQLKSGRKAGEGWQQSAYVIVRDRKSAAPLTMIVSAGLLSTFLFKGVFRPWLFFGTLRL